ncbi:hypothetical protein ACFP2T_31215 [Plantactinospora solaniradicis]|uniref:Uncharacterized protein n=1 Tax=Plantactinospora solaniradicis TaxID=1723736 RepID=A0ABW1KG11_9ACTN
MLLFVGQESQSQIDSFNFGEPALASARARRASGPLFESLRVAALICCHLPVVSTARVAR